eukprot:gene9404-biopygen7649
MRSIGQRYVYGDPYCNFCADYGHSSVNQSAAHPQRRMSPRIRPGLTVRGSAPLPYTAAATAVTTAGDDN